MTGLRDLVAYSDWLYAEFGYEGSATDVGFYDQVVEDLRLGVLASPLWTGLLEELREFNDAYYASRRYPLLVWPTPTLVKKPYDSFLEKTYRRNCLNNPSWPKPPEQGWTEPSNWFSSIPDLVRTVIVVKYLDGVGFLVDGIGAYCESRGVDVESSFEARTEGYYAAHMQIMQPIEVHTRDWKWTSIDSCTEVQVTTQLQEVMRQHLHRFYERDRIGNPVDPIVWQWDYKSPEFATNYLGHMLHYIEGKIVELREDEENR